MYSFESRVRYSEVNCRRNMTFPALLNYFQDCCTFQSEDLEVGIDFLKEEQAAWMLVSWQVVVERQPVFGEKIKISTWPYDFGGFYGFRNFTMEDEGGRAIAYANSVWVFMDLVKGRPRKIAPRLFEVYSKEERFPMEYKERKIEVQGEGVEEKAFAVHPSQIDTNHHVNNERYVEMAKEYLPETFVIQEMRAEYRNSAVLGDMIYPVVHRGANQVTVVLADEKRKPFAIVEFKEAV